MLNKLHCTCTCVLHTRKDTQLPCAPLHFGVQELGLPPSFLDFQIHICCSPTPNSTFLPIGVDAPKYSRDYHLVVGYSFTPSPKINFSIDCMMMVRLYIQRQGDVKLVGEQVDVFGNKRIVSEHVCFIGHHWIIPLETWAPTLVSGPFDQRMPFSHLSIGVDAPKETHNPTWSQNTHSHLISKIHPQLTSISLHVRKGSCIGHPWIIGSGTWAYSWIGLSKFVDALLLEPTQAQFMTNYFKGHWLNVDVTHKGLMTWKDVGGGDKRLARVTLFMLCQSARLDHALVHLSITWCGCT